MECRDWLKELCPEIAEWQIEMIAEHIEGIAREAYNTGFIDGVESETRVRDWVAVEKRNNEP